MWRVGKIETACESKTPNAKNATLSQNVSWGLYKEDPQKTLLNKYSKQADHRGFRAHETHRYVMQQK